MSTPAPMYANINSGTQDNPNQEVAEIVVVGGDFSGGGGSVDWTDVTGKPSTFAPTIGSTSTTAVAGNDSRLTAGAAGTATVRAIGTTATTACAGNDARLLTGTATAVNNSSASDVATLVSNYNALLAALRTRGIITGS
ncbi:hypothetical protein [Streptomyces sp. DW26H14]|uniref:hypothetical protein n=1 Tax=Streptomyces sp. DW26H14 TaxID=3435395 RepID=UPI00403DC1AE